MQTIYFLGLDLGQTQDPSALVLVERTIAQGDWDPVHFAHRKQISLAVRHLEHFPLGTGYPSIVERVSDIVQTIQWRGKVKLTIDGTGVGRPVVDLFRLRRINADITPVNVTGGNRESVTRDYTSVPKRDLVMCLRLLLERRGLIISAAMANAQTLIDELSNMQVKVTPAGREQYNAPSGQHDDLAFALSLAVWTVNNTYPREPAGDDRYCTNPEAMKQLEEKKSRSPQGRLW